MLAKEGRQNCGDAWLNKFLFDFKVPWLPLKQTWNKDDWYQQNKAEILPFLKGLNTLSALR